MDDRISLKARNRVTHDTNHYVFTRRCCTYRR